MAGTASADAVAGRAWLLVAAGADLVAAMAHLACIVVGAPAYRFMGAGEQMAQLHLAGDPHPTRVTLAIAAILGLWAAYALSGAGTIRRLPFLRSVLLAISAVCMLRGLGFVLLQPWFPGNSLLFWIVSSGICLLLGLLHGIGLWRSRARLSIHG